MYLNFVDIIIFVSAAQSLFLSVIIFKKYGNTTANRVLAVLMLSYAFVLTEMLLTDIEFYKISSSLLILSISSTFLLAPLHYMYAKYLTHTSEKFCKNNLLHFIPVVLYILVVLPELLKPAGEIPQSMSRLESNSITSFSLIINWAVMLQMVIYTVLTVGIIRRYSKRIKNIFSSIDKIRLGWLQNMIILFSAVVIMYIIENVLITCRIISNEYAISSAFAGLYIYGFGYLALLKSEVFMSPEFSNEIEHEKELEEQENIEEKKYQKSGLTDEKADEHLAALLDSMDKEQLYLDSSLTLHKLSEMLSISPHHLSEVINKKLNQNFFDFVNKYRVEKVKQDLLDPGKSSLTMLAIALEAGFNSKSSFNMIFKKQTGVTPSEFRKNNFTPG